MRKVLLVVTVLLAGIVAVGLLIAQLPADAFSLTFNGREVEGPLRVFAAGAAGMLGLMALAAACLVTAFLLCGASLLVALLLAGVGLLLIVVGLPFLAPLVVLAGLLYLAVRPRLHTRDAA